MMRSTEIITITLNRVLSEDKDDQFGYIWEKYRKSLFYYITGIMHCTREDGEDLLQEIMMKVYNNLEHYKTGRSFNAWIYAITRNHCLDFRRKMTARPNDVEYREGDCEAPDVFETVCSGALNRAISDCLEKMDNDDREMAYLRHFEGLRYHSIGMIIGMNVNSVKTRMRTIEARLRQELKGWL
jgi:RNA polymerase sigma-70 factor, ECF subfamily